MIDFRAVVNEWLVQSGGMVFHRDVRLSFSCGRQDVAWPYMALHFGALGNRNKVRHSILYHVQIFLIHQNWLVLT
jgi:hypothetical protein